LDTERALLKTARLIQETQRGLASVPALRAALTRFPLLSGEQVAMVERLTRSGAGVEVVVGHAGTGKTVALAAARVSWEASGLEVLGTSLSARAARNLSDGAGIESRTLAKLLMGIESRSVELGPGHVVVVDEAGMVGTRDLARLIEMSDAADAKLVLVGDPRQLPEIEAGGTLAALVSQIGAAELTENRRQVDRAERFALSALRQGRAEVALATYQRAGRVHTASSLCEAQVALVVSWAAAFGQGSDAIMLAVARQEVAVLNELARAELRRSGRLGPDVIESASRGFALGDRVVCLRNDRRLEVLNGMTGEVARPFGAGLIVSTGDGERFLPASYLEAGHLDHGYALTVHKVQGLTVEQAYVLGTEALTKEAGYVALSRARDRSELFVPLENGSDEAGHDPRQRSQDPSPGLTRRLSTSHAKQLATVELESGTSPVGRESADAMSSSALIAPPQRTPGGRDRHKVYRLTSQIEVGSGTYEDEPTTNDAQSLGRLRSLDHAMKLAHEARERLERERDLGPSRTPPEHDRSWGLSR
jgi:ATP-dependent exoDNAse (exonuclease V) alpha subunit